MSNTSLDCILIASQLHCICLFTHSALIQHYREGRNERQIDRPKDILVSMRRTQSYRQTKMLLLQKLSGIELLGSACLDKNLPPREWFKGIHRYQSMDEILKRFVSGKPIACAASKDCKETFHICYFADDCDLISYISAKSQTSNLHARETGVHFCKFMLVKELMGDSVAVTTKLKKDFMEEIGDFALMMPYMKEKQLFQKQYTLIFFDWDVLQLNSTASSVKGYPAPCPGVFSNDFMKILETQK